MKLILSLLISFFFICLPLCSSFFYPSYSLSSSSSLSPSISSSYIRTSSPLFPSRLLTSSLHSKISDGYYKDIEGLGDGMRYNRLGDSDLFVSKVGLGTMNFGGTTSEEDSIKLLDEAYKNYGINFFHSSEIFPFPCTSTSPFLALKIIGKWLKSSSAPSRDQIIISSSVCGYSEVIPFMRKEKDGTPTGTRGNLKHFKASLDKQLELLGTDYIDIFMIQWPERQVLNPGERSYEWTETPSDTTTILEQAKAMNELILSKKIKYWGVSNETPFGIGYIRAICEAHGLKPPLVVQNEFNLINRDPVEIGLIDALHYSASPSNSNTPPTFTSTSTPAFVAYSPLAGGSLTSKYLDLYAKIIHYDDFLNSFSNDMKEEEIEEFNKKKKKLKREIIEQKKKQRLSLFPGFYSRYASLKVLKYAKELENYAYEKFGIRLNTLALAWVYSRPYVTSTLIGVNNVEQLRQNVFALNLEGISEEIGIEVDKIYEKQPQMLRDSHDFYDQEKLFSSSESSELSVKPDMNIYKELTQGKITEEEEEEEAENDSDATTDFHYDPTVHVLQDNDDPELLVDGEFFDPDALVDYNSLSSEDVVILD